jgi:Sec-independent protein translocase protein TatA
MLRILFIALMLYLAYKVIFRLIIPIYKTTRQVKKGFQDMQQKMDEQMRQQQNTHATNASPKNNGEPVGDYIDFEEIK